MRDLFKLKTVSFCGNFILFAMFINMVIMPDLSMIIKYIYAGFLVSVGIFVAYRLSKRNAWKGLETRVKLSCASNLFFCAAFLTILLPAAKDTLIPGVILMFSLLLGFFAFLMTI